MKNIRDMHDSELKHRLSVMLTIKAALEFTGRALPTDDKAKLDAYAAGSYRTVRNAWRVVAVRRQARLRHRNGSVGRHPPTHAKGHYQ